MYALCKTGVFAGVVVLTACAGSDDPSLKELVGPQLGALVVELSSGHVVVAAQPQALKLSASALYDDAADTVTLSLTLKNASKTTLSNPKVLIPSVSEGSVTGDGSFTPADGALPYVSFGPESLAPGRSATRDVVVDGVAGGAPELDVDVDVRHSGWYLVPSGWSIVGGADSAGTGDELSVDVTALGPYGSETQLEPCIATENGRYAFFALRNQPAIAKLDLTDFSFQTTGALMKGTLAFDGSGPPGHVDGLTASPDGKHVFALLGEGCHRYRFAGTYPPPNVVLLRMDAHDLKVGARVELLHTTVIDDGFGGTVEYRGRRPSISADGTRGAVAVTGLGAVYLVDLKAMEVVDADPLTDGAQPFDVSAAGDDPRFAAISPDGATIYVAFVGGDGSLLAIDVATGTTSPLAPPTLSAGSPAPGALEFGPDGRLYYARQDASSPGLSILDPAGPTWVEVPGLAACNGVCFGDDFYCAVDTLNGVVRRYDLATDAELPSDGGGALGVSVSTAANGHGLVLTGE